MHKLNDTTFREENNFTAISYLYEHIGNCATHQVKRRNLALSRIRPSEIDVVNRSDVILERHTVLLVSPVSVSWCVVVCCGVYI